MSVHDRFPHSTAELCRVTAVQFGVLSPDEIVRHRRRAVRSRVPRGRPRILEDDLWTILRDACAREAGYARGGD
jgi:hypothetical protein